MYQFTPRDGPVVVRKQEAQFKTHWQKLVDAKLVNDNYSFPLATIIICQ
jgi:hypothetical protein